MARVFLKEIKWQLEAVIEAIHEIKERGKTDAFGTTIRPKDLNEYRSLIARKRELRKKIILFEP
jgi:hypothetical protein